MIIKRHYKANNYNKDKLKKLGFKKNNDSSNSEEDIYTYSFPISKYKNYITLTGIITLYPSGDVTLDVYDNNKKGYFAPFYNAPFYNPIAYNDDFLNFIKFKFNNVFKKKLKCLEIE